MDKKEKSYFSNILSTIASSLGSMLTASSFDSADLFLRLAYSSMALSERENNNKN